MRIIFFVCTLFILTACRKDQCASIHEEIFSYDTIHPIDWFPAYPGSYWVYNDSITVQVDANWQEFELKEYHRSKDCEVLKTDIVLLPKIENEYFYFDRLMESFDAHYNSENRLFNTISEWESYRNPESKYYPDPKYNSDLTYYNLRKILGTLDTLTIHGTTYSDILIIEERKMVSYSPDPVLEIDTAYYARNIGMIRHINMRKDNNPPFENNVFDLTDFQINH